MAPREPAPGLTTRRRLATLERALVVLIALHSLVVGLFLTFATEWGARFGGFPSPVPALLPAAGRRLPLRGRRRLPRRVLPLPRRASARDDEVDRGRLPGPHLAARPRAVGRAALRRSATASWPWPWSSCAARAACRSSGRARSPAVSASRPAPARALALLGAGLPGVALGCARPGAARPAGARARSPASTAGGRLEIEYAGEPAEIVRTASRGRRAQPPVLPLRLPRAVGGGEGALPLPLPRGDLRSPRAGPSRGRRRGPCGLLPVEAAGQDILVGER